MWTGTALPRRRSSARTAGKRSKRESLSITRTARAACSIGKDPYLAGAIKKDDVPEGREWWGKKETPSLEQMTKEQLQKFASEIGLEIDNRWSRETLLAKVQEV